MGKVFERGQREFGTAQDEIMISSQLDHPNCVRVLATVTSPQLALVMEEHAGRPLEVLAGARADRVLAPTDSAPERPLSRATIVRAAIGAVAGLRHIHSLCICHGDMHAHSLLVDANGDACLHDFSTAFRYHPEERCVWEPVDVRGFGVALLHMVGRATEEEEDIRVLAEDCLRTCAAARPDLETIAQRLTRISFGKFL